MIDQHGELDTALERVIEAARHHLAAVRAAQGRVDDDALWQAYVALNNASYAYDEQLMEAFGEVSPWDVQAIDPEEADQRFAGPDGAPATDSHPQVISVRQRRDYRVPSVSALIRAAASARRADTPVEDEPAPVEGVGEAVLELLQSGDGSLAALDVPELEPLDGVVMVSEVDAAVDLEAFDDDDPVGPFQPAAEDRLVGRLDEHPFLELDDEEYDDTH
ncbi:hypothetical protein [Salinispora tropica]|uniref:Uncharacterized protein n=1 Tax=Salinispora tropica (strain ATCC BAA-916 / DSM 44818 / JCM 13857 / NBRC 105044 / CNB-440) TaxID=369723 RepID=A4X6W1_SALTO|nr:hypothetical protein [Salinispora tropica]ABP54611.1 hypothetical protein Strop_2160 [Salinispora tropica CNB-440]